VGGEGREERTEEEGENGQKAEEKPRQVATSSVVSGSQH